MLHLCSRKRDSGREEVEVQTEYTICIFKQRRHSRQRTKATRQHAAGIPSNGMGRPPCAAAGQSHATEQKATSHSGCPRHRKPAASAVPDQAGQYQAKGARQASSRWPSVSSARQVDDAHCAGFERRHTCGSVPTGHTSTYTLSQVK